MISAGSNSQSLKYGCKDIWIRNYCLERESNVDYFKAGAYWVKGGGGPEPRGTHVHHGQIHSIYIYVTNAFLK